MACSSNDRRLRRKQGAAAGAAVSRMQGSIKSRGIAGNRNSFSLAWESSQTCCRSGLSDDLFPVQYRLFQGIAVVHLGTSMLQMGNIIKNPRIWIAPTLASAITGPLATCLFHFEMNGAAVSSGMGTCGLVGQIGVYTGWVSDIAAGTKAAITPMDWAAMILLCFVLPAVLSVLFCEAERKLGWIKDGDLKLN